MKNLSYFFIFSFVIIYSCKQENPEPNVPADNYRIKEILTQDGGKDFSKEIFTYDEEKLIKKEVVALQAVEDLNSIETITYDNNIITSVVVAYLRSKTVTELEGEQIKRQSYYEYYGDELRVQRDYSVSYIDNKLDEIYTTEYANSDSILYNTKVVYSGEKIVEINSGTIENDILDLSDKTTYHYDGDDNTSRVYSRKTDTTWVNIAKIEYKFSNGNIASTYIYFFMDGVWVDVEASHYEYDDNGCLAKESYDFTEIHYTYEEGKGNASIISKSWSHWDIGSTPYNKSGDLNESKSSVNNSQFIQQVISSQRVN